MTLTAKIRQEVCDMYVYKKMYAVLCGAVDEGDRWSAYRGLSPAFSGFWTRCIRRRSCI